MRLNLLWEVVMQEIEGKNNENVKDVTYVAFFFLRFSID